VKRYLVVFTNSREEDLDFNLDNDFWTIRLRAKNAKEARRKAWKEVNRNPGCRFLKRFGYYIWNTGLGVEDWPPGIVRAPGIILR